MRVLRVRTFASLWEMILLFTLPTTDDSAPTFLVPTSEQAIHLNRRVNNTLPVTERTLLQSVEPCCSDSTLGSETGIERHESRSEHTAELGLGKRELAIGLRMHAHERCIMLAKLRRSVLRDAVTAEEVRVRALNHFVLHDRKTVALAQNPIYLWRGKLTKV